MPGTKGSKMKLGIMQPYLFPYIGYFQLIQAVDQFVIHNDVQWIKGGWINRNKILVQGKPQYITLPLKKDSTFMKINERQFSADIENQKKKIIRIIKDVYKKAPQFQVAIQLVNECFCCEERNVSAFIVNSLIICCDYLGIRTPLVLSSKLDKRNDLHGQDRVLEINDIMSASHYINSIDGNKLYDKDRFAEKGVDLSFIKARNIAYNQFANHEFVPFLSIIDVMMFNSQNELTNLLKEYDLY